MIIEYVHTRNKNSNSERDVLQCGDRRKKINVKVIRDKEKKKERKRKKEKKRISSKYCIARSWSLIHSNVACSTRKSIKVSSTQLRRSVHGNHRNMPVEGKCAFCFRIFVIFLNIGDKWKFEKNFNFFNLKWIDCLIKYLNYFINIKIFIIFWNIYFCTIILKNILFIIIGEK